MNEIAKPAPRTVIPAEQIQKRVREMGRQISDDYRGQSIHLLALLENGFMFMADLVRALDVPVICQFIKPQYRAREAARAESWRFSSATSPTFAASTCLVVEGTGPFRSDQRVPDERPARRGAQPR